MVIFFLHCACTDNLTASSEHRPQLLKKRCFSSNIVPWNSYCSYFKSFALDVTELCEGHGDTYTNNYC